MENNETYFKILLDKIVELTKENENLKIEIEELKKPKKPKITKEDLDTLFSDEFWDK